MRSPNHPELPACAEGVARQLDWDEGVVPAVGPDQDNGLSALSRAGRRLLRQTRVDEGESCPASTIFAGWRQSVLPVHLLGVAPLLGSVGAVAGDVKLQDDGVMDHPVDCRGGGHGVGEDAFPLREDQV